MSLVIIASSAGTLIEWYDLFLAIILANTLSQQLFPPSDIKFLETLAVVASSYFIRPIGSLLFGNIGDKVGRKYSFLVSLLLMGGATFLIGCLPTYAQVGWLAPVILLLLRLMQGLAISGEYSGATIFVAEHAPKRRRGFYTGFIQSTVPVGLIISLAVVFISRSMMTETDFHAYGWRIPFLCSAVLVILSYIVRSRLKESPLFQQLKLEGKTSASPIKDSFKAPKNIRLMLIAIFGGNAAQSAIMQTSQFVALYFLERAVKLTDTTALFIIAVATLLGGPSYQLFGAWSDKWGRKKTILLGLIASAVLIPVSFYYFMALGNPEHITMVHSIATENIAVLTGLVFLMTIACGMVYGPMGAFMLELFPTHIRYTSMGFAHNIGNGVLGGSTPLITELIKSLLIVSAAFAPFIGLLYPISLTVIAIIVNALYVPETYKREL